MDFLAWQYSQGIKYCLYRWRYWIFWILNYFSLPLLLKSLFSPWKRLAIEEKVGFNVNKFFQKFTFNLISRSIGFFVRTSVFLGGVLALVIVGILGGVGMIAWIILPIIGLPVYLKKKNTLASCINELSQKVINNPEKSLRMIFQSKPGIFVLRHLGISFEDLGDNLVPIEGAFNNFSPRTFREVIQWVLVSYGIEEEQLRQKGLALSDFILAARWWDEKINREYPEQTGKMVLGKPGIGLELLFGYTPNLNKYIIDLGLPQNFTHHLIGREEIVSRMERTLTSGKSVFLTGQPGVGKRTVVLEFANRANKGLLGPQMAFRRVLEFDYNSLLSEAVDLNQKKTNFGLLLAEAAKAGNIILVIRDIHRLTNPLVEGCDFTDVFEQYMNTEELKIISIVSSVDYERFCATNLRLSKYFQTVDVVSPNNDEATSIILAAADTEEETKKVTVLAPSIRRVLEGSDRYITETPFPEKALELMDEVIVYCQHNHLPVLKPADVDTVLTEKTGISFSVMSESIKDKLNHLEEVIHRELVGQEAAVSLIAKSLRSNSLGVKVESRPIGSFLFLGPTGVGKTQTAKVLADVYFGSRKNILRYDMAEYAGVEGLERLIGSLNQNQPGLMTTAIKNKPASLLLLDEIEKAPRPILNLFLSLLDEGSVTDALGRKVDCRNLFVIATSNAGGEYIRQSVNAGMPGDQLQKDVVEYVQKQGLFSPEFLNRFDGVVVFEPIKKDDLSHIAELLMNELKDNLKVKGIYLEVTPEVCARVAQDGYDPAFGARPMRRVVELVIGDLLGRAVINGEIREGDKIKIIPGEGKEVYTFNKISN